MKDQQLYSNSVFGTSLKQCPPLVTTNFSAVDEGNFFPLKL